MHDLMHEKWKLMQKEGYKGLTGHGRGKPCKKNGGKMTKNRIGALTESYRDRKSWNFFEKVSLNTWKSVFKKFSTRFSINWKTDSIGRKCFDWSNTNQASIELNRDSQTFLVAISISWNSEKINFSKNKAK